MFILVFWFSVSAVDDALCPWDESNQSTGEEITAANWLNSLDHSNQTLPNHQFIKRADRGLNFDNRIFPSPPVWAPFWPTTHRAFTTTFSPRRLSPTKFGYLNIIIEIREEDFGFGQLWWASTACIPVSKSTIQHHKPYSANQHSCFFPVHGNSTSPLLQRKAPANQQVQAIERKE